MYHLRPTPYSKTYVDSLSRYKEVLNKALCEVQEYCREKEWLCEIRAFVRTWKSVERYKGAQASYIQVRFGCMFMEIKLIQMFYFETEIYLQEEVLKKI